jgi:hypothetical protein
MRLINWLVMSSLCIGGVAVADDKDKKEPPAADKAKGDASAEVKVGTGIDKHEITGEAATFPTGTTVFVWSRIINNEGTVKHVWKKDGETVWTATLPVSSKRWSTQTRRTIGKASNWEVEVQTESGQKLGSVSFKVE